MHAQRPAVGFFLPEPTSNRELHHKVEILDAPPPIFMTPKKKRTVKLKKKLDDSFLRRSKRVAEKLEGYKNEESAKKAKEKPVQADEPMPLVVIPGPAPHLPKEIIEGIAHGFLQIQPEAVSSALLDQDDLND